MAKIARKLANGRLWRFYAYLVYAATLLMVVLPILCWLFAPAFSNVSNISPNPNDSVEYIAALSSFYQTIIAILSLAIGVFSVVAFVTIRHTSRVAAEDMAADAARRVIEDSRTIQDDIENRIEESFSKTAVTRIEQLESQIKFLSEAIKRLEKERETASESTIILPD